jgi:hypothetical protein
MESGIVTAAMLVKKFSTLKITSSSRKRYHVPPIEYISDNEQYEKGMIYLMHGAYTHIHLLYLLANHVVKRVRVQKRASVQAVTETDDENNM